MKIWLEKNGPRYRVRWIDATGKKRTKKAYTSKRASEELLKKVRDGLENGDVGLADPFSEHRKRPLVDHLNDWLQVLVDRGNADKYIKNCRTRIERLATECQWNRLDDIDGDAFERWRRDVRSLAQHRQTDRRLVVQRQVSQRTLNHFYDALRSFTTWLRKKKRMPPAWVPLETIDKLQSLGKEKIKRRALTQGQVNALLAVAPERYHLSIRIALATGLRRNELRQLRWSDLNLRKTDPYLQLRAETTKGGRADVLPIQASIATVLTALGKERGDEDGAVVTSIPSMMRWRRWLSRAGIPWLDARGRRADFHALRYTYCTNLAKAGVPLQHAQQLMRHRDPKLTANIYTDAGELPLPEGVAKLPEFSGLLDPNRGAVGAELQPDAYSAGLTRTHLENRQKLNRSAKSGENADFVGKTEAERNDAAIGSCPTSTTSRRVFLPGRRGPLSAAAARCQRW